MVEQEKRGRREYRITTQQEREGVVDIGRKWVLEREKEEEREIIIISCKAIGSQKSYLEIHTCLAQYYLLVTLRHCRDDH